MTYFDAQWRILMWTLGGLGIAVCAALFLWSIFVWRRFRRYRWWSKFIDEREGNVKGATFLELEGIRRNKVIMVGTDCSTHAVLQADSGETVKETMDRIRDGHAHRE